MFHVRVNRLVEQLFQLVDVACRHGYWLTGVCITTSNAQVVEASPSVEQVVFDWCFVAVAGALPCAAYFAAAGDVPVVVVEVEVEAGRISVANVVADAAHGGVADFGV